MANKEGKGGGNVSVIIKASSFCPALSIYVNISLFPYRNVVSVKYRAPEWHQLGQDGGATLQQSFHQAEEVEVDHLCQDLQTREDNLNS